MRKRWSFVFGILMFVGSIAFAQDIDAPDTGFKAFRFDVGMGISSGLPASRLSDDNQGTVNLAVMMITLRANYHMGLRLALSDNFSLGVDGGIYYLPGDQDMDRPTFIDCPVHGCLRLTAGHFAIEPFGGYYFSCLKGSDYDFGGPEAGAKLMLGPVYLSYSRVFGYPQLHRFEVGVQFNDALKF